MSVYILCAAGGFALCALVVLWPTIRSRWQQRNDPPGLSRWAGGRMPEWPKGMKGFIPTDREPTGPSLPRVVPPESDDGVGAVVKLDQRRAVG